MKCVCSSSLWRTSLGFLLLWAFLRSANSRSCSSFFCRKSRRVSGLNGADPGAPLFLTPYLEKGAIDEGITQSHMTEYCSNTIFPMITWVVSCSSQDIELGRRSAWCQRQELCRLPHCQQEIQQQSVLLVLPCTHGRLRPPYLTAPQGCRWAAGHKEEAVNLSQLCVFSYSSGIFTAIRGCTRSLFGQLQFSSDSHPCFRGVFVKLLSVKVSYLFFLLSLKTEKHSVHESFVLMPPAQALCRCLD